VKYENCIEAYPPAYFFIEYEDEIKKALWWMYGSDPIYTPYANLRFLLTWLPEASSKLDLKDLPRFILYSGTILLCLVQIAVNLKLTFKGCLK